MSSIRLSSVRGLGVCFGVQGFGSPSQDLGSETSGSVATKIPQILSPKVPNSKLQTLKSLNPVGDSREI